MIFEPNDKYFMELALAEAERAAVEGEVPVGCVIVHEGMVIGKGHNRTEGLCDPTAHAEILAITAAANHLETWRLENCTAYSTIEPCAMCAGALVLARLRRLVFGAKPTGWVVSVPGGNSIPTKFKPGVSTEKLQESHSKLRIST